MKRTAIILLLTSTLSRTATAAPDTSAATKAVAATPSTNIRFVDPYKIINGLEQWKDENRKIESALEERAKKIKALEETYKKKGAELQSMGAMAKDTVKESKREELLKLQNEIQIKSQSFEEYANRVTQEAQMKILREIENTAQDILKKEGYDLVLAGGALAVSEKIDISQDILKEMNKKYRAVNPEPKQAPAAPAKPADKK